MLLIILQSMQCVKKGFSGHRKPLSLFGGYFFYVDKQHTDYRCIFNLKSDPNKNNLTLKTIIE